MFYFWGFKIFGRDSRTNLCDTKHRYGWPYWVGLFIPGLRFPTFCEVRSRAQITVIFTVFGRDFHDFQELNVQLSKFVSKWLRSEKKIFEILDRIFFL